MKTYLLSVFLFLFAISGCQYSDENDTYDVVVIGGGLMGSSAAYQLARAGQKVILLEKQDSIYSHGSSYGEARIARSNNRGNDIWSYLHNRSLRETRFLVNDLNEDLNSGAVSLEDVYTTSPVTYVGRTSIYDRLVASLIRQDVTYDIAITPEEGRQKFDVNLPEDVLIQREYNQYSGTMNPKVLIHLLHRAIRQTENQVRYGSRVTGVSYDDKSSLYQVNVKSEKNGVTSTLTSKKIVSAAGPYTGQLLVDIAPYFNRLINPQRVFLAFLSITPGTYGGLTYQQKSKLAQYYPVINSSEGTRDGSFFSMIEYYDKAKRPVIKIGGHFQRSEIDDLDAIWKKELEQSEIDWSLRSTASYMEMLDLPIRESDLNLIDGYSCVYSLTESEVPYVTPLIDTDGGPNTDFIVMGGMSGVGAKGAMTYGLIAADLILKRNQTDTMHLKTVEALGFDRLVRDVEALK